MEQYSKEKGMSEDYLILVDKNDNAIGKEEKVKCHLPNGLLHRAFTALLFDKNGQLLLTQRSPSKMLWPGDWDGTAASHPRESETYVSSGERRIPEELGISCRLEYLMKFEYHVPYKDVGSENEICGTLIGVIDENTKLSLIEDEISAVKWTFPSELVKELAKNPESYCPWMLIALNLLPKSEKNMLKKYEKIISKWTKSEIKEKISKAIDVHLPKEKWRLVE